MRDDIELLGQVKLPIPAGWIAHHHVTIELPFEPFAEVAFRPNIVVVRQRLALSAMLDSAVADRVRLLAQHLPGFEPGIALPGRVFDRRAVRMTYTWLHAAGRLRQLMVLSEIDAWLFEFTFSDVVLRFEASVVEFEGWLSQVTAGSTDVVPSLGMLFGRRGDPMLR
jgi:hypothetical protein